MTAFLSGHTFQTRRLSTTERGHLTSSISLPALSTWQKYASKIHGMFVAGVVTKRNGFSSVLTLLKKKKFLSVDPFKEKANKHRTLHLGPQRAGLWSIQIKKLALLFEMNIPKYTAFKNGGWRKIYDYIYKPKLNKFKIKNF